MDSGFPLSVPRRTPRIRISIGYLVSLTVASADAQTISVYPQGTAFPLQLYALAPDSQIPLVTPNGWNIGHRTTSATVLFQDRTVPITDGNFIDAFSAWGVNIYKIED